jgi:hypothetical protein
LIFRDEERGSKISVASVDLEKRTWRVEDLSDENLGSWEPSFDIDLWKQKKVVHLFVQRTEQADAEGVTSTPAQMIKVIEWSPKR